MHRDSSFSFFFNDTATTEIYTLSLHDALPILIFCRFSLFLSYGTIIARYSELSAVAFTNAILCISPVQFPYMPTRLDRKSTRLNSSHANISYAVFCLKKKKNHEAVRQPPAVTR